jgi:hypothetical protein
MPIPDLERPYTLRDVLNMLHERLPAGKYSWINDPEGNASVQAYGGRWLPAQPIYVNHRPSVVKMQVRFTPRRISPSREEELWQAAEALRKPLRAADVSARRAMGNTQETERDEQWILTLPERLSEEGYEALAQFAALAAACMGIETED